MITFVDRGKKPYHIKEMFYSLQGEGAWVGRPAIFCRFSKCNLWNGRERDRLSSVCQFCDTDFIGTDGQNGGVFTSADSLAHAAKSLWRGTWLEGVMLGYGIRKPYLIATGGEPLLQLDAKLIAAFHDVGFEVGVETNGTLAVPDGVDWLCVSPKADAELVVTECDELKLVFPQLLASPERFESVKAKHYFLSPKANPDSRQFPEEHTQAAIRYCLKHPQWRLSLQMHKLLGID